MPQALPAMWKSGMATRFTLAESKPHSCVPFFINASRLRLVSSTPLGSPVVPEV